MTSQAQCGSGLAQWTRHVLAAVHRGRRPDPPRPAASRSRTRATRSTRRPTDRAAWPRSTADEPDLVLLDLRLPDIVRVRRLPARIRAKSIVPIIIVTAQTDTHDMVAGPRGRRRRLRHQAGRAQGAGGPHPGPAAAGAAAARRCADPGHRFGDLELRREQGIVLKRGEELSLTKTEFRLLCEFADHAGAVLSPRPAARTGVGLRLPRRLAASSTPTSAGCG